MVAVKKNHLGADDGVVDAVVADLDGDLSVRKVRSDEWGLDFNVELFPGVCSVPDKQATDMNSLLSYHM